MIASRSLSLSSISGNESAHPDVPAIQRHAAGRAAGAQSEAETSIVDLAQQLRGRHAIGPRHRVAQAQPLKIGAYAHHIELI